MICLNVYLLEYGKVCAIGVKLWQIERAHVFT